MARPLPPISFLVLAIPLLASGCLTRGGEVTAFSIALDTHGASNTQCTLTVANGDRHLSFEIRSPDPSVPDTSLATLAAPTMCTGTETDGGRAVQVGSREGVALSVTRTSTTLCARSSDSAFMTQLGFDPNGMNGCPVLVSLSCGGVVFYDRVAWMACLWLG